MEEVVASSIMADSDEDLTFDLMIAALGNAGVTADATATAEGEGAAGADGADGADADANGQLVTIDDLPMPVPAFAGTTPTPTTLPGATEPATLPGATSASSLLSDASDVNPDDESMRPNFGDENDVSEHKSLGSMAGTAKATAASTTTTTTHTATVSETSFDSARPVQTSGGGAGGGYVASSVVAPSSRVLPAHEAPARAIAVVPATGGVAATATTATTETELELELDAAGDFEFCAPTWLHGALTQDEMGYLLSHTRSVPGMRRAPFAKTPQPC